MFLGGRPVVMQLRRVLTLPLAALVVTLLPSPASAAPVTDHELPFPCGQEWSGSTRDRHSPSRHAVDFNRPDDVDDPVVATAPGTVTVADAVDNSGYGRWVVVDHGNGERSFYAHLDRVMVSVGQRLDQGQQLGTLGTTGNSSGPHLHFEQREGDAVVWPWFGSERFVYDTPVRSGNCVDVPLAGNWVGDRTAEPTVFRRGVRSQFRFLRADGRTGIRKYGRSTDEPVIGDWDGNGRVNPGLFRPSRAVFRLRSKDGRVKIPFGAPTDLPVSGDWDGDGRWEVGTWTPATATFALRAADGTVSTVVLGDAGDLPVTGDWNGDGTTDVGAYDPTTATWTLRKVDTDGTVWHADVVFGSPGDLPVTGDWDANRSSDLGAWTPANATFSQRRAPSAMVSARQVTAVRFGRAR